MLKALAALIGLALLTAANLVSGVRHLTDGRPGTALLAFGLAIALGWLTGIAYGHYQYRKLLREYEKNVLWADTGPYDPSEPGAHGNDERRYDEPLRAHND